MWLNVYNLLFLPDSIHMKCERIMEEM